MTNDPFRTPPPPKYLFLRVIESGHADALPNALQAKVWIEEHLGADTVLIEETIPASGTESFRSWLLETVNSLTQKYPQTVTGLIIEWIGDPLLGHLLLNHPLIRIARAKCVHAITSGPFELRPDGILITTFVEYRVITDYGPVLAPFP